MTYTLHPIQVKLLQSLGLRSTLITDGSQPVNLFTTAQGLLGAIGSGPSNPEKKTGHIRMYTKRMYNYSFETNSFYCVYCYKSLD